MTIRSSGQSANCAARLPLTFVVRSHMYRIRRPENMKMHLSLIWLIPLIFSGAVLADSSAPNSELSRAQMVSEFLSKLRLVVNSGRLDAPDDVGKLLELSFASTVVEEEPQPADCSQPMSFRSRKSTTSTITGTNWYRPMQNLRAPGYSESPPFTFDESYPTTVSYVTRRSQYCSDPHVGLRDRTETTLEFNNLPRFACIHLQDIVAQFPTSSPQPNQHEGRFYHYSGAKNDDSGSVITFWFRPMFACAMSARIEQSAERGLRYEKADAKFRTCRNRAMNRYRQDHPPITWTDPRDAETRTKYVQDISASDEYMLRMCGTFEEEYRDAWSHR